MTRRRAALLAMLGLTSAFGVVTVTPSVVQRIAFFRIHAVEITGLRYQEEEAIVRRLALPADASILHPLDAVQAAALAIPGVQEATVARRWPGTLVLDIVEIPPVALTAQDDRLVLLDARGRVLPFAPTRVTGSLPIASRDSATAALLARMQVSDPLLYDQVQWVRTEGAEVTLVRNGHQVRLRVDADERALRAITAVQAWLEATATPWVELDGRFDGRVFVRKGVA
jgi:cell division septal protein FtsQ